MAKMLNPNYLGEIPEVDKHVYRTLHKAHCERANQPGHECQGTISIRHDRITARCPLCGNCSASLAPNATTPGESPGTNLTDGNT